MEEIIQHLKNIFADPNYRSFSYVEVIWKSLKGMEGTTYLVLTEGFENIYFSDITLDISIYKLSKNQSSPEKFVINIYPSNGWNTRLEIQENPPTLPIAFDLECD